MGIKYILPKRKASTASASIGSSRKRKAETVGNVSKRKKNKESVSESNSELKKISDYVNSDEDVAMHSASDDSEESEDSGRKSADGDNDPLSVSSLSRFISMDRMTAYREVQQFLFNQDLKKRFKRSCFEHQRNLPEHLKFNGQLVHYLLLRRIKNDSTKVVDTKLIRMVDSLSFFENYPWGKETFQLTLDYLKKKSDLKKQREVFDEKQKEFYALFGFSWAFMVWIYVTFPHLGKFAGKPTDEPFPIPRILRWHTTKSDQIIEGDPFKYKGKVTEDCLDACDLRESERNEEGEKRSKMDELASIAAGEEKKKDEEEGMEEHMCQEESSKEAAAEAKEEAEKETIVDIEKKIEKSEEAPAKEAPATVDDEIEGEEDEHEEAATAAEKKGAEADQKDVVMDIVGEINSNICVDEEDGEIDI
ncbi:hypothetical protein P3L10_012345 [Capsicum annuum]